MMLNNNDMTTNFELKVETKEVNESNLFLRAFCSEISEKFGGCNWYYSPVIYKDKKEVYLGQFTTKDDLLDSITVILHYKNKGGISKLVLNSHSDISKLQQALNGLNKRYQSNLKKYKVSMVIESSYPLSKYENELYKILPLNDHQTSIDIFVLGYNSDDLNFAGKKKYNKILDLFAGISWLSYKFSAKKQEETKQYSSLNSDIYSENIEFDSNCDNLVKDGLIYLPKKILTLIGKISNDDNLSFEQNNFLTACQVYHSALKIEGLTNHFILNDIDSYEDTITKYMSVLEILTLTNESEQKCEKCGQAMFSISKRVKEFLIKVFKENYGKELHKQYTNRSKYLHTGKYLSTRSYFGITIPQLQNNNDLIDHQILLENGNIKYSIGICLKYYLDNIL